MREGWKEIKLKEICKFKYGKNLPESKRVLGKYPVYGSSGIVSYHKDYLLKGPGIIVGRKGTVGKVQYSKSNFFPIDTTFYIEEDKSLVDLTFLYYRLSTSGLDTMNSDAAVPGLNRTAAINQKIHLPPLPTQRRIASILSAYDDLIENNLKRIKLLEEMAQKTYEEWFVRFKFPGYETAKFDKETGLPEGWKKGTLNDLIGFISGYAFKSKDFQDKGVSIIKIKNIGNNTVDIFNTDFVSDKIEVDNKFHLVGGDLIIAMTGATIGKVGFIPANDKKIYLNQRVGKLIPKGKVNNIVFAYTLFNSEIGIQQILNFASGAAQPNISGKEILSVKTIVPNEITLNLFRTKVTPMINTTLNLYYQNQRLKEARDILLPRLMTGMIDAEKIEIEL